MGTYLRYKLIDLQLSNAVEQFLAEHSEKTGKPPVMSFL